MIKVKLSSPTNIIHKPGLKEFDLSYVNGVHVLTARGFKQVLKSSEYAAIMAMASKSALKSSAPVVSPSPATPETAPAAMAVEAKFEDDDIFTETNSSKKTRRRGVI